MRLTDAQLDALRILVARLGAAPDASEKAARARGLKAGDAMAFAHGYLGGEVKAAVAELGVLLAEPAKRRAAR